MNFSLKQGLDIPIAGAPDARLEDGAPVRTVGLIGDDYIGLKPRILVAEGDVVGAGTPMMHHKDNPEAMIVSPAAGRVRAINRGARRKLISIEIDVDDSAAESVDFSAVGDVSTVDGLVERLCAAGVWTAFRTRPYSKVPMTTDRPAAILVTAMDTEPLSADPAPIIAAEPDAFVAGLESISRLAEGKTYLCHETGADVPVASGVEVATFSGPHPAGLAGTHIHFLEPISGDKVVWTISYQDVLIIGRLMLTGRYDPSVVIALGGPRCADPRLMRTVMGASMTDLTEADRPHDVPVRLISGSVLSGRAGAGNDAYLGRYARQITIIEEDHKQIPMGWIRPMFEKYAVQPVLGSTLTKVLSKPTFALTSNLNGGRRAMVPLGTFEGLMPQDYLPTQLLRAMLVMDTDVAQQLGALELDEEDLGLCGFSCPAKYEYGLALRDCLTKIEKEG
ncbi:MAG: Na(+)-translocating NADH-quinone reductase subunit A [Pseudomonadota bacterium]